MAVEGAGGRRGRLYRVMGNKNGRAVGMMRASPGGRTRVRSAMTFHIARGLANNRTSAITVKRTAPVPAGGITTQPGARRPGDGTFSAVRDNRQRKAAPKVGQKRPSAASRVTEGTRYAKSQARKPMNLKPRKGTIIRTAAQVRAIKPSQSSGSSGGSTRTIQPRRVRSGGEAIGAAHQSFFDIGKFLKGK